MFNVVDKYLLRKKNDFVNYTKKIIEIVKIPNNKLYNGKQELIQLIKGIVDLYVDKFYYDDDQKFDLVNKYFNFKNDINIKLKVILLAVITYLEKNGKGDSIVGNEGSVLTLTIIIFVAYDFDLLSNPYCDDTISFNGIKKNMIAKINSVSFIAYNKNCDKQVEKIVDMIKNNRKTAKKFFAYLDSLDKSDSYNTFIDLSGDNKYYQVNYHWHIESISNERPADVTKIYDKMALYEKFIYLSYELASITVLKSFLLNKRVELVIPISYAFFKKKSNVNKLSKMLNNLEMKKKLKLFVKFSDFSNNLEPFENLVNNNFKILVDNDFEGETNNYNMFQDRQHIYTSQEFLDINVKYKEIWESKEKIFIIKNIGEEIDEDKLLGFNKEEVKEELSYE